MKNAYYGPQRYPFGPQDSPGGPRDATYISELQLETSSKSVRHGIKHDLYTSHAKYWFHFGEIW